MGAGQARIGDARSEARTVHSPDREPAPLIGRGAGPGCHVAETALRHVGSYTTLLRQTSPYCSDLANAWPRLAFEVCAPAQNGTAISANARCDSHTSLKNAFASAFFSSDALAAFMYSLK